MAATTRDKTPSIAIEDSEYTVILSYEAACDLIAGRVPHELKVACISGIKSLSEEPAVSSKSRQRTNR